MADVVVVGSLNMDLVVRAARFPRPGETLTGEGFGTFPGGKGANQAAACALLGMSTAMVGRVGADAFGEQLCDGLEALGVDVEHVRVDEGAPTGTAMIVVDAKGENAIVVVPGANGRLGEADIAAAGKSLQAAACMVAQLEVPLAAIQSTAERVHRSGGRVILNAAPAQTLPDEFLRLVDDLVVNETEASMLSGVEVEDEASAKQAAECLRARGAGCVVVTLGARGALVVSDGGSWVCPARNVHVVDTTAAGDAFVGAWASALARGEDLPRALRYAVAAGTLATTVMGAQPSLPTHERVMRFLEADRD